VINRWQSDKNICKALQPLRHNQPPFYGHYTGQPASAGTSILEDLAGAKFYCPHALAGGDKGMRIREKTLEFSSTVLSTSSCTLPIVISKKKKEEEKECRMVLAELLSLCNTANIQTAYSGP